MLNNDPDWDPALFAGTTRLYYGRWMYKYESAARQGAAGAIIIHTTPSAGYPWQVVQSSWGGEQFELPAGGEPRVADQGVDHRGRGPRKLVGRGGRTSTSCVERRSAATSSPCRSASRPRSRCATCSRARSRPTCSGVLRGQRPEARRRARDLQRASRSPRRRRAGRDASRRHDLQRRARQRGGVATVLGDRAGVSRRCRSRRGARCCSCCSSRRRSRACSARSTSPSIRRCRRGRSPPTSTTTAATSGARRATSPSSALGKSLARRGRQRAVAAYQHRVSEGRPVPGSRLFYRSDQFNFAQDRRAGALPQRRHRLRRPSRRAGASSSVEAYTSSAITSRATSSRRMELRRHGAGRTVRLLRGLIVANDPRCRAGTPERVRGEAARGVGRACVPAVRRRCRAALILRRRIRFSAVLFAALLTATIRREVHVARSGPVMFVRGLSSCCSSWCSRP